MIILVGVIFLILIHTLISNHVNLSLIFYVLISVLLLWTGKNIQGTEKIVLEIFTTFLFIYISLVSVWGQRSG